MTTTPQTKKIRQAYAETIEYRKQTGNNTEWVGFAELREMAGMLREDFDTAIRQLDRAADVVVTEETNQKALRVADRDAAVKIGPGWNHVIKIG